MIRFLLMLPVIILTGNICLSQTQLPIKEKDVPQYCLENFKEKYPDATAVQWVQGDPFFIDVNFSVGTHHYNGTFATSGGWVSTSERCSLDSLPATAHDFVEQKFPGAKYIFLYKTDTVAGLRWELTIRKKKLYEFVFDMTGFNLAWGKAND